MFGAVPLVAAGPAVKAQAAAALGDAGVPAPAPATSASPAPGPEAPGPEAPGSDPSTTTAGAGPGTVPGAPGPAASKRRAARRIAILATAAVLLGAAGVALATRGDGDPDLVAAPSGTSTTTEATTTSSAPPTSPVASPTTATAPPEPAAPVTDPAGATSPTSPTTTSAPPPPPEPEEPVLPVVDSFGAEPLSTGNCGDAAETPVTFSWSSTGATSARLGPGPDPAMPVDPAGEHTACAIRGSSWTLAVTGAGGTATATATVR
jgi:hypothetical protein